MWMTDSCLLIVIPRCGCCNLNNGNTNVALKKRKIIGRNNKVNPNRQFLRQRCSRCRWRTMPLRMEDRPSSWFLLRRFEFNRLPFQFLLLFFFFPPTLGWLFHAAVHIDGIGHHLPHTSLFLFFSLIDHRAAMFRTEKFCIFCIEDDNCSQLSTRKIDLSLPLLLQHGRFLFASLRSGFAGKRENGGSSTAEAEVTRDYPSTDKNS